jgi:hypothetical protein
MTTSDDLYQSYYELAFSLQHQHRDHEKLTSILITKGCDQELANNIVTELKRINNFSKRQTGIKIIGFGCVILLIGFILTCACYHYDAPFQTIMFGFTTVGLLILFIGLTYIF